MPTLYLSNTSIQTKLFNALIDNSSSYSTDLSTLVTVAKSAIGTKFRFEPGTTNITSGDFLSTANGWRYTPPANGGSFTAGGWTFNTKFRNQQRYAFTGKLEAKLAVSTDGIESINSLSYGNYVFGLATDDTYVYAGGDGTSTIKKYLKSDMSYVSESLPVGARISALVIDDIYIYIGDDTSPLTTSTVKKYLKSDLSYISESPPYGGRIQKLVLDDIYIYANGKGTGITKRYLKSDMSYLLESPPYGGDVNDFVLDSTYIYVSGYTSNSIKKYLKSDLSYVSQSALFENVINSLVLDNEYIYIGGYFSTTIRKYLKSNLSYVSESAPYTNFWRIIINGDYIYGIGDSKITYKFLLSDFSYLGGIPDSDVFAFCSDNNSFYMSSSSTNQIRRAFSFPLICTQSGTVSLPATAGATVNSQWTTSLPKIIIPPGSCLYVSYTITITTAASSAGAQLAFICDDNPTTGVETIVTPAWSVGTISASITNVIATSTATLIVPNLYSTANILTIGVIAASTATALFPALQGKFDIKISFTVAISIAILIFPKIIIPIIITSIPTIISNAKLITPVLPGILIFYIERSNGNQSNFSEIGVSFDGTYEDTSFLNIGFYYYRMRTSYSLYSNIIEIYNGDPLIYPPIINSNTVMVDSQIIPIIFLNSPNLTGETFINYIHLLWA